MKATLALSAAIVLGFLLHPEGWGLHPADPFTSELLSHQFAHNSWEHLVANLVTFLAFGTWFERRAGALATAALFLLAGALGGLTEALADPGYTGAIVGASGGVSAFLGVFARLERWAPLIVIPVLGAYSWEALDMAGSNADWSHLTGFAVGLLCALFIQPVQSKEVSHA